DVVFVGERAEVGGELVPVRAHRGFPALLRGAHGVELRRREEQRIRLSENRRERVEHGAHVALLELVDGELGSWPSTAPRIQPALELLLRDRTAEAHRHVERKPEGRAKCVEGRARGAEARVYIVDEPI